MTHSCWAQIRVEDDQTDVASWLSGLLKRNAKCAYLKQYGSPASLRDFREQVPVCSYENLLPYIDQIQAGEADVLFSGTPVAYERTGGSSGGSKLIPYTEAGLNDFQKNILPWLAHTVRRHRITGRAYFSISPATRVPEFIGTVPVGLSDAAYLGDEAGYALMQGTAVPLEVAGIEDVAVWRGKTLERLCAARDLQLISVWSPTFILRLLDGITNTSELWPQLKVISCWASGPAQRYIEELRRLFPHAAIEPKGLLSTEAAVTVPNEECQPVLARRGYFEFLREGRLYSENELSIDDEYEVLVTTASGLYRYTTGDRVRYKGLSSSGRPILDFVGRDSLTSDLVGEKLTEAFVGKCLQILRGFAMLVPDFGKPGYVLISENEQGASDVAILDEQLCRNSQYAYARKLGQLASLRALRHPSPFSVVETVMNQRGVRLGDVKPTALRNEDYWLPLFQRSCA